jgi:two-component system chemotaxis sensor kinase CheA
VNALLEQFLSEARDALQGIGEKLMLLEEKPDDASLMNELFRLVHTLKGNSGLFDFPEMTRVLHAGEDLMSVVRNGKLRYSRDLADRLMEAMDFVAGLCDEAEAGNLINPSRAEDSTRLAEFLRELIPPAERQGKKKPAGTLPARMEPEAAPSIAAENSAMAAIPEELMMEACRLSRAGNPISFVVYRPSEDCFFQGADPLHTIINCPDRIWGRILPRETWPPLAQLNTYRCALDFQVLSSAPRAAVVDHFRYVADQVEIIDITPLNLVLPRGTPNGGPADEDLVAEALLQLKNDTIDPIRKATMNDLAFRESIIETQRQILLLPDKPAWHQGRLFSVAAVLANCCDAVGNTGARREIEAALGTAIDTGTNAALLSWLDAAEGKIPEGVDASAANTAEERDSIQAPAPGAGPVVAVGKVIIPVRAEDTIVPAKSLKVDQSKIDRLMNLIGEMVVSKNALPYLAQRAETQFGARELSREIKAQYAVINRIAEEMQDAIMQVRMLPVSFVFQRFPRMVREISRKLGKEVRLELIGEETELDKNIIESLADPLVHIVRNSIDHGLELPEVRRAAGKFPTGTITLRAAQDADRVIIEISDDGKGIDPEVMKRKAYEKGFIDEAAIERMTEREALNLVFAAGLSTAQVVSDLSGRGVGMDVVRNAVEKCNGTIDLKSEIGKGTSILISLPLSMAVTQVMIVESDGQLFGVPMDHVVETVRIPRKSIRSIKRSQTTTLRDRIVPLKSLNALLGLSAAPLLNTEDETAVLVTKVGSDVVGILVDDFRETVGIIQKPLEGSLGKLGAYSGSAILGDGSVLMVLNLKGVL